MNDSLLIQKIISSPVLKPAIDDLAQRNGALNLVCLDWENVLNNHELYQRHCKQEVRFSKGSRKNVVHLRNIIGLQNCYNILVVGYWYLDVPNDQGKCSALDSNDMLDSNTRPKKTSLVCRLCTPLIKIGESMKESNQQKFSENCRFFIELCDPAYCCACKEATERYQSILQTYLHSEQWCIRKTRVFNGESIKHLFKASIESIFGNNLSFVGILNLQISSRYTFGENSYKIGGTVREMILLKESTLSSSELDMDIEMPIPFNQTENYPSITFPNEEDNTNEKERKGNLGISAYFKKFKKDE